MKRSRAVLFSMAALWLVDGLVEPIVGTPGQPLPAGALLQALAMSILIFLWCKADSSERGPLAPSGPALLSAVVPPIGIPIYFFRTRSWRRALVMTVLACVFVAGLATLSLIGNAVAAWCLPVAPEALH